MVPPINKRYLENISETEAVLSVNELWSIMYLEPEILPKIPLCEGMFHIWQSNKPKKISYH